MEAGLLSFGLRRLTGARLLAALANRCSPATPRRESVAVPAVPMFLNSLLASDSIEREIDSMVFCNGKERHVGVISLKGWAGRPHAMIGQLDDLSSLPGELTVAHAFRFLDRDVAEKTIEGVEKYNLAKSVPFLARLVATLTDRPPTKFNSGRLALAEEAKSAREDMYLHNRSFGYHNLTVVVYGDTHEQMFDLRRQVLETLGRSQYIGHVERLHQLASGSEILRCTKRWVLELGDSYSSRPAELLDGAPVGIRVQGSAEVRSRTQSPAKMGVRRTPCGSAAIGSYFGFTETISVLANFARPRFAFPAREISRSPEGCVDAPNLNLVSAYLVQYTRSFRLAMEWNAPVRASAAQMWQIA